MATTKTAIGTPSREERVENPYLPYPVRIDDIVVESEDRNLKTFKFVFLNPDDEKKFAYRAGQFAELSIAGVGEIPIGIASSPVEKLPLINCTIPTRMPWPSARAIMPKPAVLLPLPLPVFTITTPRSIVACAMPASITAFLRAMRALCCSGVSAI